MRMGYFSLITIDRNLKNRIKNEKYVTALPNNEHGEQVQLLKLEAIADISSTYFSLEEDAFIDGSFAIRSGEYYLQVSGIIFINTFNCC